jgi:hypothetical protein
MLPIILLSLGCVLYLAVAVVLVRKYLRTRDIGFVWLGVAVLIWPLVSGLLGRGESVLGLHASSGHGDGFFPFSLVSSGQISVGDLFTSVHLLLNLIGIGLLLVAVIYLSRARSDSKSLPVA